MNRTTQRSLLRLSGRIANRWHIYKNALHPSFPLLIRTRNLLSLTKIQILSIVSNLHIKVLTIIRMQLKYQTSRKLLIRTTIQSRCLTLSVQLLYTLSTGHIQIQQHGRSIGIMGTQIGPFKSLIIQIVNPIIKIHQHPIQLASIQGPR